MKVFCKNSLLKIKRSLGQFSWGFFSNYMANSVYLKVLCIYAVYRKELILEEFSHCALQLSQSLQTQY